MKPPYRFFIPLIVLGALALSAVGVAFGREITTFEFFKIRDEIEITGMLEAVDGSTWTVDGQAITVPASAEIEGALVVGQFVKVHASIGEDGMLTAREIELAQANDVEDKDANDNSDDDELDDEDANDNSDNDEFDDDNANDNSDDDEFDDDSANDNTDDDEMDDDNANDNSDDDELDDDNANDNSDDDSDNDSNDNDDDSDDDDDGDDD